MNKRLLAIIAVVFLYVGSGCAVTQVQTARTNGAGNFQFGIEPGVIGATAGGIGGVVPSFNLAGRYGVTDSIDIGARLGSVGYEIQSKFMLTDPADQTAIAMSLAPSFTAIGGGAGGASTFWFRSTIPFLIGIPVGDSELTIGPNLTPSFLTAGGGGSSATGFFLSGGGEVSFAARVGDKFWLVPNFGISVPLVGAAVADGSSAADAGFGVVVYGGGVGLLFGGRARASAAPASAPPAMQ